MNECAEEVELGGVSDELDVRVGLCSTFSTGEKAWKVLPPAMGFLPAQE